MSSSREPKAEKQQSLKTLSIALLKDTPGEDKASEFGENLDHDVAHILESAKKSKVLFEKDGDQLQNFIRKLHLNKFPTEGKLKNKITDFFKNDAKKSEKEQLVLINELQDHFAAFKKMVNACEKIDTFIKQLKNTELLSNDKLTQQLTDFFQTITKSPEQAKSLAKSVADQFVIEFKATNDYFKIKNSIILFASEKIYNSPAKPESLDLFIFHLEIQNMLDHYTNTIDDKYRTICSSINNQFITNTDEASTVFEKTLQTMLEQEERPELDDEDALWNSFYNYAEPSCKKFIDAAVDITNHSNKLVSQAYSLSEQKSLLESYKVKNEMEIGINKQLTTLVDNLFNQWRKKIPQEDIQKLDIASIKQELHKKVQDGILDTLFSQTLKELSTHQSISSSSQSLFATQTPTPEEKPSSSSSYKATL